MTKVITVSIQVVSAYGTCLTLQGTHLQEAWQACSYPLTSGTVAGVMFSFTWLWRSDDGKGLSTVVVFNLFSRSAKYLACIKCVLAYNLGKHTSFVGPTRLEGGRCSPEFSGRDKSC